jgi:hypothetical protein
LPEERRAGGVLRLELAQRDERAPGLFEVRLLSEFQE